MIIRTYFRCLTCNQNHIVRIGMGQDNRQEHRVLCRGCGEEMLIALNVNYENISTVPEAIENAEVSQETRDALIVNVHANYVINEGERYTDMVFPHMQQMQAQVEAAYQSGSMTPISFDNLAANRSRPFRRPDFADEWQLLKKAWSLHSRGRDKLVAKELAAASERYYSDDPPDHLQDWVWRFSMFLGATKYELILRDMMAEVTRAMKQGKFDPLLAEREKSAELRARRYFEVFRDYFSAWGEFSQVHFTVAKGMPVLDGHVATTSGYNAVKMFYGSAFEAFASSVDILAFMNNILSGRDWMHFKNIEAKTYLQSDKPKRFDCFADRAAFNALCDERDGQLRNASHHGALQFSAEQGLLCYHEGKGNFGAKVTTPYANYLSRCSALFFQMVTLLRFELLICQSTGSRYPI